jgi:hypothetical protein
MITANQLRAARALIGWEQSRLAASSGISLPTVKRMEGSDGPVRGNYESVAKVQRALEIAGIEFISENGGGVGVRLRNSTGQSA